MARTDFCLYDDFKKEGENLLELRKSLKALDDATRSEIVRKKDIALFYLPEKRYTEKREKTSSGKCRIVESKEYVENTIENILSTGNIRAYYLRPSKIWNYTESGVPYLNTVKVPILDLIKDVRDKEAFLKELLSNRVFFGYQGEYYFVSENFISTFGMRIEMSGNALLENCLERNIHAAQRLNNEEEMTLILRNQEGVDKVYATLSGKYTYVPQSILMEIIDKFDIKKVLGKVVCKYWEMTHTCTRVFLEFPDKAEELQKSYGITKDLVPGMILEKSDIGECSITLKGTWRYGKYPVIEKEIRKKHSGRVDIPEIIDHAQKEIFDQYTLFPERLCKLMKINITDPAWKALGSRKFRELNREVIANVVRQVFRQIELVKAVTKKNEKLIYENLCNEFDLDICYTAYDICLSIMTAPERMSGLNPIYMEKLQKAVGKAPYVEYGSKTTSKIILTA